MTRQEAIDFINTKEAYDLMFSIVHYRNAPNRDNSLAKKLLDCYRLFLKEAGSRVVVPDCMGCTSGMHPLAELFVFATKNNLFTINQVEAGEVQTEVKQKRRRK